MAEEKSAPQPQVSIQKIYLKDVSLESPHAPGVFTTQEWKPDVNLQVNTETQALEDGNYDVSLTLTVTVKQNNGALYLVEVKQAGIFTIKGLEKEQLQAVLTTFCPANLFPYARETVPSLVERAGFPQLLLQPVNFDALYQQHMQKLQQTKQADTTKAH